MAVSWGEWLWDAWSEGLLGFSEEVRARFRAYRRAFGITFDEGANALRRILSRQLPHTFVTSDDLVAMIEVGKALAAAGSLVGGQEQPQSRAAYPRPDVGTSFVEPQTDIEKQIAAIWSDVLGIEPIGINDNFFDLGGNSLLGVSLFGRMRKALKLEKLPAHVLYEAPTVSSQAEYISQEHVAAGPATHVAANLQEQSAKRRDRMSGFKKKAQLEGL